MAKVLYCEQAITLVNKRFFIVSDGHRGVKGDIIGVF